MLLCEAVVFVPCSSHLFTQAGRRLGHRSCVSCDVFALRAVAGCQERESPLNSFFYLIYRRLRRPPTISARREVRKRLPSSQVAAEQI